MRLGFSVRDAWLRTATRNDAVGFALRWRERQMLKVVCHL
jgi:hypothetical protein